MKAMWTAAVLCATALLARADEKTYDLKKLSEDRAKVGVKGRFEKKDTMKSEMQVSVGEQVVKEEDKKETKEFVYVGEALEVEDGNATKTKAAFEKAVKTTDGEETTYGFQGKTVIATKQKDGGWAYQYEDGKEVAEDDVAGLKDALDQKKKKGDDESDPWLPEKPVKVGDTWSPSIDEVMKDFGEDDEEDKLAYDKEKSSATFTLKAVESRNGVEFATIAGEIKVLVNEMGGTPIDTPIPMTMELEFVGALDGSVPEGSGVVKVKFKGETTIQTPDGQEVGLSLDMSGKMTMKASPAK